MRSASQIWSANLSYFGKTDDASSVFFFHIIVDDDVATPALTSTTQPPCNKTPHVLQLTTPQATPWTRQRRQHGCAGTRSCSTARTLPARAHPAAGAVANAVHDARVVHAPHPPVRHGVLLNPKANRWKLVLDAPRARCEVTSGGVLVGLWIGWYIAHACSSACVRRGARRGGGYSARDGCAPSHGAPHGRGARRRRGLVAILTLSLIIILNFSYIIQKIVGLISKKAGVGWQNSSDKLYKLVYDFEKSLSQFYKIIPLFENKSV
ncbi:hypothetical protein DFH11DRAFT_1551128 [Phellopilus nigrolimitatus]|nr:hypothetical protein DFH11DRAFT_1551128 [Phellopilus nigrolimitatus]